MQRNSEPVRGGRGRGQTAVIAIVLLIGIVAIGSIGILLIGANATDQTQKDAQQDRIEKGFVQLQKDADSVAQTDSGSRRTNLDLPPESDGAIRKESAGQIRVKRKNLSRTQTIVVKDIGAVVYEDDDVTYAYQGGAVWRGTGNQTQMVTPPNMVYETTREGTDPTLTLPITDLHGKQNLGTGEVRLQKMFTRSPLNDVSTIDNQVVTVEVQSEYYVGWGSYFESRYPNSVVRYDHPNETVTFELGKQDIDGSWNQSVYAMDGSITFGGGNNAINGPVAADGSASCGSSGSCSTETPQSAYAPLDSVIQEKIEEAENNASYATDVDLSDGTVLDASGTGVYYDDDGASLDQDTVTVDLSAGNVTLILDGDLILDKQVDFKIENGDGSGPKAFRLYTTGDLGMKNSRFCVAPCSGGNPGTLDAEDNQFYGTSNTMVGIQGGSNTVFEGAVYAPREEEVQDINRPADAIGVNSGSKCDDEDGDSWHADFCMVSGSSSFYGGIITGPTRIAQSATVNYDPGLTSSPPTIQQIGVVPPPLTFLHVSVNKICVGDEDDCNGRPVPEIGVSERYPEPGEGVTFDAGGSKDYDGTITKYEWDLDGDGSIEATGKTASTSYTSGTHTVELTVTDDEGATRNETMELKVASNTAPQAVYTNSSSDLTVAFDASRSGDDDGGIASYEWDFDDGNTSTGKRVEHTFPDDGSYTVELNVTDDDGASDTTSKTIRVSHTPTFTWESVSNGSGSATVEFTPDDVDGDLQEAYVYVYDENGSVLDSENPSLTGEEGNTQSVSLSYTGTASFTEVRVVDDDGVDTSDTTPFGGDAPTVDTFEIDDKSGATDAEYDVSWSVSDVDGDLKNVTVTVENTNTTNNETYFGASGSETYTETGVGGDPIEIKIEATDVAGNTVCYVITDDADGSGVKSKSNGDATTC